MDQTLPRSREALSEAKRLLLEKRIKGQAKPTAPANRITRVGGGPVHPMSFAQERLWFLDQMEPGNPFYNIPVAMLVSAKVDVAVMERAFTELIRRHESLRTVFRAVDGEPKQIVQPPYPVKVAVSDARGPGGEPVGEEELRARIRDESMRPFDLAEGPLLRVDVIRVSEADSVLLVNVHHIVTDGWSMPIVTREMDELYEAYARGLPYPLKPLEVQYPDYSAWQREYLTGETLQRQVDYWRGHLRGAPTLELPTDRPRPPVLSYRGGMHRFVWPAALTERIRALSVETGASMHMVIMSGFYLLLHQYSGQDDVVVGTLLGNRNHAELESMVGFFVNTAPVRARLAGEMTFRELVAQVRASVLDADANQDLPFDRIVEELTTERDPSRSPLFQVMYFHHTFVNDVHHKAESEFRSALNLRPLYQETGITLVETDTTKFDLTFATVEIDGALANMAEYSTDLWDEASIARMMDHCRVLLDRALRDPDAPLSAHWMVTDAERNHLLSIGANARHAEVEGTLVDRFEAHAARAPQAVAVEYHDGRWTYGELDARANRVARRLVALGVRPGDHVGLALAASAGMVAALLGVLKAGAAVVPLDPEYPAERLRFMVRDAGIRVLVVENGGPDGLAAEVAATLDLVRDAGTIAAEDGAPLPPRAYPESVAYLVFTSGTTGLPKASLVPHRSLVRTAVDAEYMPVAPGDRVAQGNGLSFDLAILETWGALANGAALVGIDRDLLLDSAACARALRERGITHLCITTQLLNRHLREVPDVFARQRYVLFGGETADAGALRTCLEGGPPAHLVNIYAPSENVILGTTHDVREVAPEAGTVPLGGPIEDTRCYVLDARGMLCGTGVPGELSMGGGRVAYGYLGRPALTAERFLPDPFSPVPGARVYRTGDRARWNGRGELEFLGRLDKQVKIRGFRIEPGEVEAALHAHPAVRECVVVAREDVPGDRRLAAYVAGREGAAPDAAELRAFLKERLPDYMVPAAFVALDALPLTPNGKVDHRALPAPDGGGAPRQAHEAPRTRTEEVLAELWAKVLRVERVGIHDNFFGLGGDSILAIQIIARAAEEGIRILPRQMFVHQTVAELAAVASVAAPAEAEQGPVTGEVPLTPVQRWFLEQDQPEPHHWNMGNLLQPRAPLDVEILQRAASALLDHHDALRTRFTRTVEGWTQHVGEPGEAAAVERIDLSGMEGEARDAAFAEHALRLQGSLDLARGPVIRFALFEMDHGGQRLAILAHHLVVDAVSWGVLVADLERAYGQILRGEPIRLPAKTTSYQRWAERLAEHARAEALREEAGFWLAQGDAPPLPVDFAGGANTDGEAEFVGVALDAEETRALLHDVPPIYGTQVNDVLLAGLGRALARWTGEETLWVTLEGHGREELFADVELSRTAGLFTSIYPVRLRVPADPGAALRGVKEQLRAFPQKGIGYGILRYLGDEETRAALAGLRQPELVFNYLGQMDGAAGEERLLEHADGDLGPMHSPRARRQHLLAVDASVFDGRLYVTWTYGTRVHARETVERLAAAYLDALRELVAHCRDPRAGGYTPSDFALAGLDQDGLDALLAQIG
ncbi:MAG TPA: amino acid adenylation domain-containing protein [Longimicrobium sp.]|nr:amino acid adenylation domain-containing protein [Longimicrobium sp.]